MRNKRTNKVLAAVLGLLCCLYSLGASAQDPALTAFIADEKGFTTLYFYPSTIRMLGKAFGGVNPEAFAQLKSGRLLFTFGSDGSFQTKVSAFLRGLEQQGFDDIAHMRNGGFNMRIVQKEGKTPTTLMYFDGDQGLYLIEVVGSLDGKAMQQLMTMDVQKAVSVFGLLPSNAEEVPRPDVGEENEHAP